jgi:hypothetical protein
MKFKAFCISLCTSISKTLTVPEHLLFLLAIPLTNKATSQLPSKATASGVRTSPPTIHLLCTTRSFSGDDSTKKPPKDPVLHHQGISLASLVGSGGITAMTTMVVGAE